MRTLEELQRAHEAKDPQMPSLAAVFAGWRAEQRSLRWQAAEIARIYGIRPAPNTVRAIHRKFQTSTTRSKA